MKLEDLFKGKKDKYVYIFSENGKAFFCDCVVKKGFDYTRIIKTDFDYTGKDCGISLTSSSMESLSPVKTLEDKGEKIAINGIELRKHEPMENPLEKPFRDSVDIQDVSKFLETMKESALTQYKDEKRFFMSGSCFTQDGEVVSTDGRRLYVRKLPELKGLFKDNIINTKIFADIKRPKYLKLSMTDGNRYIKVETDNAIIVYHAIEGQFPNWKRVFPDVNKLNFVDFPVSETIQKLKKNPEDSVKNRLLIGNGIARLRDCEESPQFPFSLELDKNVLCFNFAYIQDLYKVMGDNLKMGYIPEEEGVIYRACQFTDGDRTVLIMPMRLD